MRLAIGIVLVIVGAVLSIGMVLYFRKNPRRAIADMTFSTILDIIWNDGVWTYLIPAGLIILGVMIIITELRA